MAKHYFGSGSVDLCIIESVMIDGEVGVCEVTNRFRVSSEADIHEFFPMQPILDQDGEWTGEVGDPIVGKNVFMVKTKKQMLQEKLDPRLLLDRESPGFISCLVPVGNTNRELQTA